MLGSAFTLRPVVACSSLAALCLLAMSGCHVAADGYNAQGVRDYQQGNYAQAMQRFQQAVQMDPRSADAYYNMAATAHRQGAQTGNREMLGQAEQLYNQCLDLNKNHSDAYRGLAVLLNETDRPDKAFKLLKNWVAGSPQVADARVELARLYEEFGDVETAKVHLQEAINLDQNSSRAWSAMAHIREREKDFQQALANYQRAYTLQSSPQIAQRIASLTQALNSGAVPAATTPGARTVQGAPTGNNWNARY